MYNNQYNQTNNKNPTVHKYKCKKRKKNFFKSFLSKINIVNPLKSMHISHRSTIEVFY